jgi:tetratricopeptide (TPR) repeat protein
MMWRDTVTALIACTLGLGLLPASEAGAQEKKQNFVPDAQPNTQTPATRRRTERKGPGLEGEQFVRQNTEQLAEAKWQEAFRLLNRLIQTTPDSDPAKPDLLFRLSEMYWEQASATDMRAFEVEEKCLQSAPNPAAEKACTAEREATTAGSQKYRDKAIEVYKHIVKNFPRYPRLDGVLFALGFNYQRKEQPDAAKKIYGELIRRYPSSVHVPDTLLNIGEIFFEDGQVAQAKRAYEKVTTSYRDSTVYGYALYKLGWCHYNLGQFRDALNTFLQVIEHGRKMQGGRNRLTLIREAQRDLVRTYVNLEDASPNKAIPFFQRVAPDDYLDLSETLAEAYADTGQFEKSNQLYRNLIQTQRNSYRVVSFQTAIATNTSNIGQQVEAIKELKRLVQLWRTVKGATDAEPERVANDEKRIEELLRRTAVDKHLLYVKTKNPEHAALAYDLYTDYVATFPAGPNAYEMTFYFAELNYDLKKWKDAAVSYEKALELEPKGKHTKDAAHGAVLAYKELLNLAQPNQPSSRASDDAMVSEGEEVKVPEPKPISDDHQRYIAACDLYSKYVENSEFLVDIEYDAARIYYDFNHFDKAIPRFKNIAEKHTNHRLAIFAANLLLDTYNLTKDYQALDVQVDTFLKLYTRDRDPEFYDLLLKLKQQSTFKRCSGIEASKKYLEAARCFRLYSRDFPKSEYFDEALYNAALNYEREKQIERAIEVRLALVNSVGEGDLVRKALYQIAGNLHALAIYSKASEAYEFYADNFPDTDEAKDAIRNAAVFREGLGELDKATENYLKYMKLVGKNDEQKASEVFFSLGGILEKQEEWDRVASHYEKFLRTYANVAKVDLIIEAHTRIGNALTKQKRPDEKKAQASYERAYNAFMQLSDTEKEQVTTGIAAVAEARFKMGEAIFRDLERNPLEGKSYRNVKKFVDEMKKQITQRTEIVVGAQRIYLEVIQFRSPNWAIAALARIGQMYQALGNDVYNYPAPSSFDEEMTEAFKGQMSDMSDIQINKAVEAYVLCIQKAQELRWFNQWSDLAEKELARLRPAEYRYNAEQRARPTHFGPPAVAQSVITRLPTQEEEE